jgi:hypothetical protein
LMIHTNNLVHLHKAFSSQINLIHYFLFHSDVMSFVTTEKSAVGTDLLFTINANDFNRLLMNLAHFFGWR